MIEMVSGLLQLISTGAVTALHPYDTLAHELGHVLLNDARFVSTGGVHTFTPRDLMCDGTKSRLTPGPFELIFKSDNQHDVIDDIAMVRGGENLGQIDAMYTSSSYVTAGISNGSNVGDFNADGIVNAADVTLLYTSMGQASSTHDLTGDGMVSLSDAVEMIGLIPGALLGDLNSDGQVNEADLATLEVNWQTPAGRAGGDIDGDGLVTVVDLEILASDWQGPPVVSHNVLVARSWDRVVVPLGETLVPAWEVNWAAHAGIGYQLETSADLQTWSPLGNQIVADGWSVAGLVEMPALQRTGFVRLRGSDAQQVSFGAIPRFSASRLTWNSQAGEIFTVENWRGSGPPGVSGAWEIVAAIRALTSGQQHLVLKSPDGQSGGGYFRVMRAAFVSGAPSPE
jgi:hypothetical protein